MIQTYKIEGMTCDGCVAKVKSALEEISHIQEAKVQLEFPQVEIKTTKLLNLKTLQNAKMGNLTKNQKEQEHSHLHQNNYPYLI